MRTFICVSSLELRSHDKGKPHAVVMCTSLDFKKDLNFKGAWYTSKLDFVFQSCHHEIRLEILTLNY